MLRILHIENIAVIEKTDVEFGRGLNVLTGETGAGKSIVIDAMGAVLGSRLSRELVRAGAAEASVTAVFTAGGTERWCEDNGVSAEDGELFITRRISADGKNTCRVGGCPVSVSQLRELGSLLLDIHGQNDGQRLLDEKYHLEYLDNFGKTGAALEKYRAAYEKYKKTASEIESLSMDESEKQRRIDTLRFQIDELERADITPGETEEKSARRDLMKNAGKLTEAVEEAFSALYGDDSGGGAISLIGDAESSVSSASRYSDELDDIAKKLTDLRYSAQDVSEQLREMRDTLDFSPGEYDALEERLELLRRLSRKYGGSEEEMLSFLDNCRSELDNMEFSTQRLEKLEKELEKCRAEAMEAGGELSEMRKRAASELERRIESELGDLSMKGAVFTVEFGTADKLTRTGLDTVCFTMSANAGEKPGRIAKVASGGELARIMLAMKNVLSGSDTIGTMVFDEIDTGVSGVAAQRVGEKLSDLAAEKQVICVTHLPQIAAMADSQYVIEKRQSGGRTFTSVSPLDEAGRMREIARLSGGENITGTTLSAAKEQLEAARKYKSSARKK